MREKHLELIQLIVSRLAGNCFLIKGWCITLVAALCAIAISDDRNTVYLLAYIPTALFGLLDAYYLWLERRYRALYEEVATSDSVAPYIMNTDKYKEMRGGYYGAFFSVTVAPFYITLATTIFIVGFGIHLKIE